MKKNNQRKIAVAAVAPMTPTTIVSQRGPQVARKPSMKIKKTARTLDAKYATIILRPSHITTRIVAPSKDQNLERTAAYVVRARTGSFQRRWVTRLREAPPITSRLKI